MIYRPASSNGLIPSVIRELCEDREVAMKNKDVINSTVNSLIAHLSVFPHFKVSTNLNNYLVIK